MTQLTEAQILERLWAARHRPTRKTVDALLLLQDNPTMTLREASVVTGMNLSWLSLLRNTVGIMKRTKRDMIVELLDGEHSPGEIAKLTGSSTTHVGNVARSIGYVFKRR